jgi:hypothetical protein
LLHPREIVATTGAKTAINRPEWILSLVLDASATIGTALPALVIVAHIDAQTGVLPLVARNRLLRTLIDRIWDAISVAVGLPSFAAGERKQVLIRPVIDPTAGI